MALPFEDAFPPDEMDRLLAAEGARWRAAAGLGPAEVERLLEGTLARLGQARPSGVTPHQGVTLLRLLLEPICGIGAAAQAIDLSLRRSVADSGSGLDRGTWSLFVRYLSDAIAAVCGTAAGRLVDRAGLSVSIAGA